MNDLRIDIRKNTVGIISALIAYDPLDRIILQSPHQVFGSFLGMLIKVTASLKRMRSFNHLYIKDPFESSFTQQVSWKHIFITGTAARDRYESYGIALVQF